MHHDVEVPVDLTTVGTLAELANALNELRAGQSYSALNRAGGGRLPSSTLSNLLQAKSMPSEATLTTFLTACGLTTEQTRKPWLAVRERVETAHLHRPVGAVRVLEARPRVLGVHAAIRMSRNETDLPAYVARDFDADLRSEVTAAAVGGGFVLLTGGASVGKSRALFEAVTAVLGELWLLQPADSPAIQRFATAPTPRTVLWLDELQRYLTHPDGLPVGTVRTLITEGVVLVATLWPDEYGPRVAERSGGPTDPYANDRELLGLARVIDVPPAFSDQERRRAEGLAGGDERLRVALDTPDAGITQVLAGGPELVRWWEQAPADQCYGQAIITAALDARRVGARTPISRDYLAAAAPGYLSPAQQATAPADWLDQALAYATTQLRGAASALSPIPAGMGRIGGYAVADFLHQRAVRTRRTDHLPHSAWNALVDHHTPNETFELANSAAARGRLEIASGFYSQLVGSGSIEEQIALFWLARHDWVAEAVAALRLHAEGGNPHAARLLATILFDRHEVDEAAAVLRPLASYVDVATDLADLLLGQHLIDAAMTVLRQHTSDAGAALHIAEVLVDREQIDEAAAVLRPLAANAAIAQRLADILVALGQVDEAVAVLRPFAGDGNVATDLAEILIDRDQADEAIALLSTHVNNIGVAIDVAEILVDRGRVSEAVAMLRPLADDVDIAWYLAGILVGLGQVDEAVAVLRPLAGDGNVATDLAEILIDRDQADEAIALLSTHVNNIGVAIDVAEILVDRGRVSEAVAMLRPLADDVGIARRLADALLGENEIDEATTVLRRHRGDAGAALYVMEFLVDRGRVDEAVAVLRPFAHDVDVARRLADILVGLGQVDEAVAVLYPLADEGDVAAVLAEVLVDRGRVDEAVAVLRPFAHDVDVARRLADILVGLGQVDEAVAVLRPLADDVGIARRLADALLGENEIDEATTVLRRHRGDAGAALYVAEFLVDRGRISEVMALLRPLAGNAAIARRLADFLLGQGQVDEAIAVLDTHQTGAASSLVDLLERHGLVDLLDEEVAAGTWGAAEALQRLRMQRGSGSR